jgi:hypothetical protein
LLKRSLQVALLLVCAAAAGLYVHFLGTGLTAHRYLRVGLGVFEGDSTGVRHWIANTARAALLDSELVSDPVERYPPSLAMELPPWRGAGASTLQRDTLPRYTRDGRPIAIADSDRWRLTQAPPLTVVRVFGARSLADAVREAAPGTVIELEPGTYRLTEPLELARPGRPDAPIVLRGGRLGDAVIEVMDEAPLLADAPYWSITDLTVRGACPSMPCGTFLRATAQARALTVRNLFATGITTLVSREGPGTVDAVLIEGVTLLVGVAAEADTAWRRVAERNIFPPLETATVVICATPDAGHDCSGLELQKAVNAFDEGGVLLLRRGVYRQAALIRRPGIHLLAEPGAVLEGTAFRGKGALVVRADLTVEGLECREVRVRDGNGTCLRQEHGDVMLRGVHFHHNQMGVLTGHNGGNLQIYDSYFHDSGYDESGNLGHNIYVNSGTLEFTRSWSIAARNAGHELKSRAERTVIQDSLIASLNARDSRLVDVPQGGILEISGSVLAEGPRSENHDLIGYGLEVGEEALPHAQNYLLLESNTFYADRPRGAMLLNQRHARRVVLEGNVVVGDASGMDGAARLGSQRDAGLPPYPALPAMVF